MRPTWQPTREVKARYYRPHSASQRPTRNYVRKAVDVFDGDIAALRAAGATFLGTVEYDDAYAKLAARVGGTHVRLVSTETVTRFSDVAIGQDTAHCTSYGDDTTCTVRRAPTARVRHDDSTFVAEVYYVAPEDQLQLPAALQTPPSWYW